MTPDELLEALAEIDAKIKAEPIQIGKVQGGDTAWWCHLCHTGDQAEGFTDFSKVACGKAAVAHVLGLDHEAQKVLAEGS